MALDGNSLQEIVAELVLRPGHEKVRGLLYKLLTDGLGAKSADVTFEHQTFEIRGRIDALLGRTVIELKSDLRRESFETQLASYLKDRRNLTGEDFVGIATMARHSRCTSLPKTTIPCLNWEHTSQMLKNPRNS